MQKNDWRALTENGIALLRQNEPQQALTELLRAERQAPDARDVRYWLANAYRMLGQTDGALVILRKLLVEKPDDFDAAFAMATALRDAGRPGDAAKAMLDVCERRAITVDKLLQITGFLRDSNQFDAAIHACKRAINLQPEQADLHFKLARLYQAIGSFDLALDALRKTVDLQPSVGPAWIGLAQQQRFRTIDDVDYVRIQTASNQSYGNEADMCVAFALGKALDDLQQWPQAWTQYQKGNQYMTKSVSWNGRAWSEFVERSIDNTGTLRSAGRATGRRAVFIVGMPRSGTTLLEQLLDRHPDITGRGEQNFLAHFAQQRTASGRFSGQQRREMAEILWTQQRLDGPEDGLYIDKNPLNFRYLDVLFDLLPTAKVLHITRDGRDSCLSCYFQLFQHADTAFCNDLEDLATFYAEYRRLLAHWEKVYTGRIHRVNYQALVSSNSETLDEVLKFLGLEWHSAVTQLIDEDRVVRTASVWQARQPIHTRSVNRWRHYFDEAPDFFTRLSDIDAKYDAVTRSLEA